MSPRSPAAAAVGPRTVSVEAAAGREPQGVADAGEHDQAFDLMIAVGAPAEHAQREIDLGGRPLDARCRSDRSRHGSLAAALARAQPPPPGSLALAASVAEEANSGRPVFSFCWIAGEIVGFRPEIARMRPLKARLDHAADLPIGIAQVIVDGRILGLELDGAVELLDRLLVFADPVIGPAQRVDDVAIVRAAARRRA